MKNATLTFNLLLIGLLALTSLTFADGILRVPQEWGDDILCPLRSVNVDVEIHEQVAITTVRNSFFVESEDFIRAFFHYRLPATASVSGFGIWIGENFLEYELRPGEQGGPGGGAGDNPDLGDFLGENPFSIPIDSIPPGTFRLQIRYVELLPYDFGVVQMMYPLDCGGWLADAIDTVSIEVQLDAQRGIQELEVTDLEDYSEIELEGNFQAHVSLYIEDFRPEEDWGVNITFNQEDIGAWLYTHRSDLEKPGFFMLVIEPGIVEEDEQVQKYFTFVVDRSGSMRGEKIQQARLAVHSCLDHMLETDYFNIIDFEYEVHLLAEEMLLANAGNIQRARQYIDRLHPEGGTNIYGALMEAITQEMGENTANQVIFTTDGLPTAGPSRNPDVILNDVTEANEQGARIFSFGIGNDVDVRMLTALSERNHGLSIFFNPNEARIDSIIADFYRYISNPALVNPVVSFAEGLDTKDVYPPELQDVAAGKQIYLFGRYLSFGSFLISLTGSTVDGDTTMEFEDMPFPEEELESEFVPRMWAKSVIDYWLRWIEINGERQDIIDLIIELSLEYGILTPYTEYEPPEVGVQEPAFARIDAEKVPGGIHLNWTLTGVSVPLTFNVYRAFSRIGEFVRLNNAPLTEPHYFDNTVPENVTIFYRIETIADGVSYWSELIIVGEMPVEISLIGPSPNPFNARTKISYILPEPGNVVISLYDIQGHEVRRLLNGAQTAGVHLLELNGTNLSAGSYILRFKSGDQTFTRTVVLLR